MKEMLTENMETLLHLLKTQPPTTPSELHRLVKDLPITQQDLEPFAKWDYPETDGYGRALVHQNKNFEVMVMTWRPGATSAVHDHGHIDWGAVYVMGPATHRYFAISGENIRKTGQEQLQPRDWIRVNQKLLHQMSNRSEQFFLTLHIYGTNHPEEPVATESRVIDPEAWAIHYTNGGAFFDLPESEILHKEPGPTWEPEHLREQLKLRAGLVRKAQPQPVH